MMISWNVSAVILPPSALRVITPAAAPDAETYGIQNSHRDDPPEQKGPTVRRLVPTGLTTSVDLDDVYRDLEIPSGGDGRPYVVTNMVATVDGKSALSGMAAGIGSPTDATLMRQIRAAVDAVMHGAGTLRAEIVDPRVDSERSRQRVLRGLPPQPLAVAVSGSLDLEPASRFLVNGPSGTVILTSATAPQERRAWLARYATLLVDPGPDVDLVAALRRLHDEHGVRRLLSEGGPTLNQRLLDAGLIDELFLTIAPKLAGGRGRTTIDDQAPTVQIRARLDLVSVYEHEGELFARYRARRGHDGAYLA
jgi:2,5-diamino-6-(ribosylamino)-4(3H)-pyrimidinone 5'-phosphate reductase